VVTAQTVVYTGAGLTSGLAYAAADNTSSTTTTVSEEYAVADLDYNDEADYSDVVQTVIGTTVGVPTNAQLLETTTTTYVFVKDGTYTKTVVYLAEMPAIAAVAATASAPAVPASIAGTVTITQVTNGYYTNTKRTYGNAVTSGYYDTYQNLYLYEQTKTHNQVATGLYTLVTEGYSATALTAFDETLNTEVYEISVNGDSIVFAPSGTPTVYIVVAEE